MLYTGCSALLLDMRAMTMNAAGSYDTTHLGQLVLSEYVFHCLTQSSGELHANLVVDMQLQGLNHTLQGHNQSSWGYGQNAPVHVTRIITDTEVSL